MIAMKNAIQILLLFILGNAIVQAQTNTVESFIPKGYIVFDKVFGEGNVNSEEEFNKKIQEGSSIKKGEIIAEIKGLTGSILKSERTAINFLGLISGIATKTNYYVNLVKEYKTKICCTRKTLPTLRAIQKYAVTLGGGTNNRFNLFDEMINPVLGV